MPKLVILERELEGDTLGLAYQSGRIIIDPRQLPEDYLDTLVHELIHVGAPEFSEKKTEKLANLISKGLWKWGYRRI
jgi:hypothetical protein